MTEIGCTLMGEQSAPAQLVDDAGGRGKPRVGQVAVCYDRDAVRAV